MFMLHDLEEIIMVEKWINKHQAVLYEKLPRKIAAGVVKQFSMSTAQFSVAVLVIFLFVSASTYMASQFLHHGPLGNIHFFTVCILVFFLHAFTHIGQSLFFRSITPGVITSIVIILPYSIVLFHALFNRQVITWQTIFVSLPFLLFILPVVLLAHEIGKRVA
ncbi:HXXEE domain-containing protein [Brevibacillus sp. SYP-B805]|nr:HXXEE domain-containing protein [Brevibacillus sp. SYP-B805]